MKKKFLNFIKLLIKEKRKDINSIKLEEIMYGIECIYLTLTKFIIILFISFYLNIYIEMILLLIFFNILRKTGFGLHASKSYICLLSSSLIFILLPLLSRVLFIPIYIKSILSIIAIILIYKNTPADTIKRPIIDVKLREKLKFKTTLKCIILSFVLLFIENKLSNLILFGIYIEVFLTSPFIYNLFNLSYNNYINYELNI